MTCNANPDMEQQWSIASNNAIGSLFLDDNCLSPGRSRITNNIFERTRVRSYAWRQSISHFQIHTEFMMVSPLQNLWYNKWRLSRWSMTRFSTSKSPGLSRSTWLLPIPSEVSPRKRHEFPTIYVRPIYDEANTLGRITLECVAVISHGEFKVELNGYHHDAPEKTVRIPHIRVERLYMKYSTIWVTSTLMMIILIVGISIFFSPGNVRVLVGKMRETHSLWRTDGTSVDFRRRGTRKFDFSRHPSVLFLKIMKAAKFSFEIKRLISDRCATKSTTNIFRPHISRCRWSISPRRSSIIF